MTNPTVNIAIPVYLSAEYLAPAIESVLGQSYADWRLVVSQDGGRTEDVATTVQPYLDDPRVSYVIQGQQLGAAVHKQLLTDSGHASYIAILDYDDVWLPGWLERRVSFMQSNPECGLVWGGHLDLDSDGRLLCSQPHVIDAGVHDSLEFTRAMLSANLIVTPSVLFSRAAYDRAGGHYEPRFAYTYDYELWMRIGLAGPVGYLGIHDSGYRVHAQQSSRVHDRALDHLGLLDRFDELLAAQFPQLRLSPRVRRRERASRLLSVALDAADRGDLRTAATTIGAAARADPFAIASRRGLGAVAATVGGRRARALIAARRR